MRLIDADALIDALHTWFRDGFDEDRWWNSTHVLAAIEGLPSAQQGYKWETCFECPLSHGCPKIKGCTNGQAIECASQIPNDCPLSTYPDHTADIGKKVKQTVETAQNVQNEDLISRKWLVECIEEGWVKFDTAKDCNRMMHLVRDIAPSVQPEQNGKWIYNSPTTMKCDRCGFAIKDWDWHRFKYCPNCRADMRGDDVSEVD